MIRSAAVLLLCTSLLGCTGASSDEPTPTVEPTAADTPTATDTPSATAEPTATPTPIDPAGRLAPTQIIAPALIDGLPDGAVGPLVVYTTRSQFSWGAVITVVTYDAGLGRPLASFEVGGRAGALAQTVLLGGREVVVNYGTAIAVHSLAGGETRASEQR